MVQIKEAIHTQTISRPSPYSANIPSSSVFINAPFLGSDNRLIRWRSSAPAGNVRQLPATVRPKKDARYPPARKPRILQRAPNTGRRSHEQYQHKLDEEAFAQKASARERREVSKLKRVGRAKRGRFAGRALAEQGGAGRRAPHRDEPRTVSHPHHACAAATSRATTPKRPPQREGLDGRDWIKLRNIGSSKSFHQSPAAATDA
ncbi:hypothetical protein AOQ84DRAFT_416210 [Glonium stellatum]|uniref:Uncharacterized protein n=1 Tax=Glonium stellatum TaxID=574774 RepID=A0A8E2JZ70_9PEZI|nr:hypothetical protein AOQ84DRAFT_416210 [Glonium stellatum]